MDGLTVEMRQICKSFNGVKVLENVDITILPGEVHALVGGNGAGKSTLMKILEGVHVPNDGDIFIDGRKVAFGSPLDARKAGISMIFQELSLIPTLTVAENIFLTKEKVTGIGLLDDRESERRTREMFTDLGVNIDPKASVETLSAGYQQLTEIVKALSQDAKVLIMDEPTASLTSSETDALFLIIEKLKTRGISIVYISHRMEEIFKIADRTTILRDGKIIATETIADIDLTVMIEHMVGRKMEESFQWHPRTVDRSGTPVLELQAISNTPRVKDVSLKLYKGEVLGIVGLMGSGRTELLQTIFGIQAHQSGRISINGREITIKKTEHALKAGIGMIPEDRRVQGLIMDHALDANILLPLLSQFVHHGLINDKAATKRVVEFVKQLNIRTNTIFQSVRSLSGGNQQKVVVAKWLGTDPQILLMDEPTAGVDIEAKTELIALVRRLTEEGGKSVILVSSELPELLAVSDRILLLKNGVSDVEMERRDIESETTLHHIIQGN